MIRPTLVALLVAAVVAAPATALLRPPGRGRVVRASARRHRTSIRVVILGVISGAFVVGPPAVVVIGATWVTRRWRYMRRRRRDAVHMARAFPDLIDLFVIAVRVGLPPPLAMRHSRPLLGAPLRDPVETVCRRLDDGAAFAEASRTLLQTVGPAARSFVDAIVTADRYGLRLGPVLDRIAAEAREQRRRDGEASARELPVRLAAPLVLCTLPSFALLAIVPLLIGALSSLHL
jgi:tight adherence protein C